MLDNTVQTYQELKGRITNDLTARTEWARKDGEIVQRRLGFRPKTKNKPYPGAPNYVEMLIDDAVREKTDQEISMLFNAPRVCHAAPLDEVTTEARAQMEIAFDSYVRYVIPQCRAKLEEALDTKNCRGFSVLKLTRSFSRVVGAVVPDFIVKDILDIILPPDTKHIQSAEYVCDVLRYTPRELKKIAAQKSWDMVNVNKTISTYKRRDDLTGRTTGIEQDTYQKTKAIVGITTSTTEYMVVWEVYRYADENDEARNPELKAGRKMVSVFCPDSPEDVYAEFPWREGNDSADPDGDDRPWPYVQPRYETRSCRWYDSRGAGHLIMDEQIGATAMRNAEATMIEYFLTPMLKGPVQNSQNISFTPGSSLPEGVDFVKPPDVPQQFTFTRNDFRATAGRRIGASGMYNYSKDVGSRKLQKTATEVQSDNVSDTLVSSASVDRFNEPLAELWQLLWEDMKRMQLVFPIISSDSAASGQMVAELYTKRILLIPAASAKTLNPDQQLARFQQMFAFNAQYAQFTGFQFLQAIRAVNAAWDTRMTRGWVPDAAQEQGLMQRMQAHEQALQSVIAGGQALDQRVGNVEQLATRINAQTAPVA